MKELEPKQTDKLEIVTQAKKDIQRIYIGSKKPKKNHILFEVNVPEKTIEKAKFNQSNTITLREVKNQKHLTKEVTVNKDCIYISAMNKANVIKILKRDYNINF